MFLRAFWEAQMHAYEHAAGWVSHGARMLNIVDKRKLTFLRVLHDTDLLELQDGAVSLRLMNGSKERDC
jgi:hypothetical protein